MVLQATLFSNTCINPCYICLKMPLTLICIRETSVHLAAVTFYTVCLTVCVCSVVLFLLWSNRSRIGLNMAAWSLAHHTSQPQPLSADYKLQSWLQIMTEDVLARLKDVQQKTHTHRRLDMHTQSAH